MLAIVRRERILELLQENNVMSVEELATLLNVSHMTIRRDLNLLKDLNLLERTFGAAYLKKNFAVDRAYEEKEQQMVDEKKRIADYAVTLIDDGDSIILDAGTTNMELAKNIASFQSLTVITNDIKIALHLLDFTSFDIYLTGGKLNSKRKSCSDMITVETLGKFNVDISFIGCNSFDVELGATTPTVDNAYVKQAMINAAERSVLLADNSKYNKKSMSKISDLGGFHYVVTNEPYSDTHKEIHDKEGFNFIYT